MRTVSMSRYIVILSNGSEANHAFQQIDLGEETGPRTVVSGLVKYIPIEEMRDRYLVAVV
jgi:tRNA-binding EMAP/Myf-like protein